jgi:hypothetical protein
MSNRIVKLIVENADGSIYIENDLSLYSEVFQNSILGITANVYEPTDKKVYLKCGYKPIDFFAHRNLTQNDTN